MSITRSEFFERVLPQTGHICLVGLMADKSAPAKSSFYPVEQALNGELDKHIDELVNEKREVYFGCATFKDPKQQRTAKNAEGYKCFRIDVDCGPGKEYPTQKEGLKALQQYLLDSNMPTPIIVNSGRGWHAYWALDKVIDYNTWKFMADALKESMRELRFKVDGSVTADGARILRIPGTFNNKDRENPKAVGVLSAADVVAVEELKKQLGAYLIGTPIEETDTTSYASAADDPLMKKMLASSEKKFSKILELSTKEKEVTETVEIFVENKDGTRTSKQVKQKVMRSAGCAQIDYIYKHQADENFNYELWRAGISIAANCSDWETAIHTISSQYPEYDPYETLKMAEGTKDKPQLCRTFQSIQPELCLNCPLKQQGKITTPITLGMTLIQATPLDNIQDDVWHQDLNEPVQVEIPSQYPKPWFRPKNGGVAYAGLGDDDENGNSDSAGDVLVYPNDLWVKKRRHDPQHGSMVQLVRILPLDGMKEFTIPLSFITKRDKLIEALSQNGVAVHIAHLARIQQYIIDWVRYLENKEEEEKAREQFGWQDDDTAFVIGTREITREGNVIYSPPCSTTQFIADKYTSKGTIENWKKVANAYNAPGNEARAFCLFVSMGSPLYKFFNVNSPIIHLMNSDSGVGKSTVQMTCCSVWGHPVDTMMNENDTILSQQQRASVLSNIIMCTDEITNMNGAEVSNFVYRYSFNRARNRVQAQINAERKNNSAWAMPAITSGNNSLYDTLKSFKAVTQGETFRILEIHLPQDLSKTKEEADYLFNNLLHENYGLIGEELMKYTVPNVLEVVALAKETQKEFDALIKRESRERMYSAMCASAFTMARIAKKLGLHDIDIDRVMKWVAKHIVALRATATTTIVEQNDDMLGQFFLEHARNILSVNDYSHEEDDEDRLPSTPLREPFGELVIRYEPNTRHVYIARNKLQTWLAGKRMPLGPMLEDLRDKRIALADAKLCLSRGTSIPGASVWAVCLHADKLGWDLDNAPIGDIDLV